MGSTKSGILRFVSRKVRKINQHVKVRRDTPDSPVLEPPEVPPDMVGDLPINARAALTEVCEAIIVAYGLEMWDQILNDINHPENSEDPVIDRPHLLPTAERHSSLLYADTKIRAVIGSEPRT